MSSPHPVRDAKQVLVLWPGSPARLRTRGRQGSLDSLVDRELDEEERKGATPSNHSSGSSIDS